MPFPTAGKAAGDFRDFSGGTRPGVRAHYLENHRQQSLAFVIEKKEEYLPLRRGHMGVFEALDALAEVVDASDPDLGLGQRDHSLQTAEALREAGRPRWMILTGLVHDLGKVLRLYGEPQCAGQVVSQGEVTVVLGDSGGVWQPLEQALAVPAGAVSALCAFDVERLPFFDFSLFLDDAVLTGRIFGDGFESGDTSAWSATAGE